MVECQTNYKKRNIVGGSSSVAKGGHIMLPGVQVTAALGFFLYSSHLSDSEDSDSLL